ncbi:MAG: hypothetical protein P8P11_00870 [Burkholderiales bacterium]|jgi:hypothetical protein|nr:hypothetical protein [Burkholderiales bacterium]
MNRREVTDDQGLMNRFLKARLLPNESQRRYLHSKTDVMAPNLSLL